MAAQHRPYQNRSAFIGAIILTVIAVAAVIAALIYLAVRDDGDSQASANCDGKEVTLPVAEQAPGAAAEFVARYTDSDEGSCTKVQIVDNIEQAALFVAVDSPATDSFLDQHGLARVEGPAGIVGSQTVGVATTQPVNDPGTITADHVFYPSAQAPDVAVAAATALTGDASAAQTLVARDRAIDLSAIAGNPEAMIATIDTTVPEGKSFTAIPNAVLPIAAIPVASRNGQGASVDQSRAAVEAAQFAANTQGDQAPKLDDNKKAALLGVYGALGLSPIPAIALPDAPVTHEDAQGTDAQAPATGAQQQPGATQAPADQDKVQAPNAGPAEAMDTLFLLDASDQIAPSFRLAIDGIDHAARDLQGKERVSALWNYSSPLNPGVTRPWRDNLGFTQGSELRGTLDLFGTGGVPMTRTSVLEAARAAQDHAAATGAPVRLVLVTSGTAAEDAGTDPAAFALQFRDAAGENVHLTVVHVGSAPVDPALEQIAGPIKAVTDPAQIDPQLHAAVGA